MSDVNNVIGVCYHKTGPIENQQIPVGYDYEELKETLKAGDTYGDG